MDLKGEEDMYSYNLAEQGVPYEMSDKVLVEDPNGEWVKWRDHQEDFFRFTEIYEKRIRELKAKIGGECNCRESQELICYWWICPAHGYKRR